MKSRSEAPVPAWGIGVPFLLAAHQTGLAVFVALALALAAIFAHAALQSRSPFVTLCDALTIAFRGTNLRRSFALTALIGVPATAFYLVALPAERFGAFALGALRFLTPGDALASAIVGFGVALTVALNVAAHRAHASQTALTFGGVVAALLPSSLCCTSLIPSLLAALGASAPAVLHLTGRFQGVFAVYAAAFIGFAVLAVLTSVWLAAFNLTGSCATRAPIAKEYR